MLRTSCFVAVAALLVGCGDSPYQDSEQARVAEAQAPVVGGSLSPEDQDAEVYVFYNPSGDGGWAGFYCGGILLAPNLVATPRHCVSIIPLSAYQCGLNGEPINDGAGSGSVLEDGVAENVRVYFGNNNPLAVEPTAFGVELLDDGSDNLCSHDIAFLVLDEEIDYVRRPLRLDPPEVNDLVTVVGWGNPKPETQMWMPHRTYLDDIPVTAVGEQVPDPTAVGIGVTPRTFETPPAICTGDSGAAVFQGPANAISGLGIRRTSANGDPAVACDSGSTISVYMQFGPFEELLLEAHEAAGQDMWLEGEPNLYETPVGNPCTADKFCTTRACELDADGDSGVCTTTCTASSECVGGKVCEDRGHNVGSVCVQSDTAEGDPPETAGGDGGCTTAPGNDDGGAWWLVLSLGLVGLRRRAAFTD